MWWKIVLIVLLVVVVVVVLTAGIGSLRWKSRTEALLERLEASRATPFPGVYDPARLEGLPAPVQRYFRTVLKPGQPLVAGVKVEHNGTFNMKEDGEQWKNFTSHQSVTTQRPGFVWNAAISVMPGLTARVHDAYVAGEGILTVALLGLIQVVNMDHTPELARGEFMRWCAEAVWYPTALLPGAGVKWTAIDDHSAMATFRDGDLEVDVRFHFKGDGLIDAIRVENRQRVVEGKMVSTHWEGRFWNYSRRNGMLIPLDGDVAWLLPQGRKLYWQGRIRRIEHIFARRNS